MDCWFRCACITGSNLWETDTDSPVLVKGERLSTSAELDSTFPKELILSGGDIITFLPEQI